MTTYEQYFNKTVLASYGKSRGHKGDIGLEIECEGPLIHGIESGGVWKSVPEGSLRNGMEYVLRNPLPIGMIPKALEDWAELTKTCRFEKSIRTSVHVHVNVQPLVYSEVLRFLGVYWLVENILVGLNGKLREGNLFCLRIRDADALAYDIFEAIESKQVINFNPDYARYAALNLVALSKFNSLEFRFVKGTTVPKTIQYWTDNLYDLVHRSTEFKDLGVLLKSIDFEDILPFLELILPPALYKSAAMRYTPAELSQMVYANYDLALKLESILKKEVKGGGAYRFVNQRTEGSEDLTPESTGSVPDTFKLPSIFQ